MKRLLPLLFLLISCVVSAQEISLDAPDIAKEHTLVRVKVQSSQPGDYFLWDVIHGETFIEFEAYRRKGTGEQGIVFTGSPGRYLVKVTVLREDELLAGKCLVLISGVEPPGPGPNPPTPPGPTPPGPTPPPGPLTDEVAKASLDATALLPSLAKARIGQVLAAYRAVIKSAEAAEPGYATIQEIQSKLQADRALAQGDPASWAPWNDVMKVHWDSFWIKSAGKASKTEVLAFHKSVAMGLEIAAK